MPRGRELVSYYANSIAHLLGPFDGGGSRAGRAAECGAWRGRVAGDAPAVAAPRSTDPAVSRSRG